MSTFYKYPDKKTRKKWETKHNLPKIETYTNPLSLFPAKNDTFSTAFFAAEAPRKQRKLESTEKWLHPHQLNAEFGLHGDSQEIYVRRTYRRLNSTGLFAQVRKEDAHLKDAAEDDDAGSEKGSPFKGKHFVVVEESRLKELTKFERMLRQEKAMLGEQCTWVLSDFQMKANLPVPATRLALHHLCDTQMHKLEKEIWQLEDSWDRFAKQNHYDQRHLFLKDSYVKNAPLSQRALKLRLVRDAAATWKLRKERDTMQYEDDRSYLFGLHYQALIRKRDYDRYYILASRYGPYSEREFNKDPRPGRRYLVQATIGAIKLQHLWDRWWAMARLRRFKASKLIQKIYRGFIKYKQLHPVILLRMKIGKKTYYFFVWNRWKAYNMISKRFRELMQYHRYTYVRACMEAWKNFVHGNLSRKEGILKVLLMRKQNMLLYAKFARWIRFRDYSKMVKGRVKRMYRFPHFEVWVRYTLWRRHIRNLNKSAKMVQMYYKMAKIRRNFLKKKAAQKILHNFALMVLCVRKARHRRNQIVPEQLALWGPQEEERRVARLNEKESTRLQQRQMFVLEKERAALLGMKQHLRSKDGALQVEATIKAMTEKIKFISSVRGKTPGGMGSGDRISTLTGAGGGGGVMDAWDGAVDRGGSTQEEMDEEEREEVQFAQKLANIPSKEGKTRAVKRRLLKKCSRINRIVQNHDFNARNPPKILCPDPDCAATFATEEQFHEHLWTSYRHNLNLDPPAAVTPISSAVRLQGAHLFQEERENGNKAKQAKVGKEQPKKESDDMQKKNKTKESLQEANDGNKKEKRKRKKNHRHRNHRDGSESEAEHAASGTEDEQQQQKQQQGGEGEGAPTVNNPSASASVGKRGSARASVKGVRPSVDPAGRQPAADGSDSGGADGGEDDTVVGGSLEQRRGGQRKGERGEGEEEGEGETKKLTAAQAAKARKEQRAAERKKKRDERKAGDAAAIGATDGATDASPVGNGDIGEGGKGFSGAVSSGARRSVQFDGAKGGADEDGEVGIAIALPISDEENVREGRDQEQKNMMHESGKSKGGAEKAAIGVGRELAGRGAGSVDAERGVLGGEDEYESVFSGGEGKDQEEDGEALADEGSVYSDGSFETLLRDIDDDAESVSSYSHGERLRIAQQSDGSEEKENVPDDAQDSANLSQNPQFEVPLWSYFYLLLRHPRGHDVVRSFLLNRHGLNGPVNALDAWHSIQDWKKTPSSHKRYAERAVSIFELYFSEDGSRRVPAEVFLFLHKITSSSSSSKAVRGSSRGRGGEGRGVADMMPPPVASTATGSAAGAVSGSPLPVSVGGSPLPVSMSVPAEAPMITSPMRPPMRPGSPPTAAGTDMRSPRSLEETTALRRVREKLHRVKLCDREGQYYQPNEAPKSFFRSVLGLPAENYDHWSDEAVVPPNLYDYLQWACFLSLFRYFESRRVDKSLAVLEGKVHSVAAIPVTRSAPSPSPSSTPAAAHLPDSGESAATTAAAPAAPADPSSSSASTMLTTATTNTGKQVKSPATAKARVGGVGAVVGGLSAFTLAPKKPPSSAVSVTDFYQSSEFEEYCAAIEQERAKKAENLHRDFLVYRNDVIRAWVREFTHTENAMRQEAEKAVVVAEVDILDSLLDALLKRETQKLVFHRRNLEQAQVEERSMIVEDALSWAEENAAEFVYEFYVGSLLKTMIEIPECRKGMLEYSGLMKNKKLKKKLDLSNIKSDSKEWFNQFFKKAVDDDKNGAVLDGEKEGQRGGKSKIIIYDRYQAARIIQRRVRGIIARNKLRKLFVATFEKHFDAGYQANYYLNTVTGESSWERPKIIRHLYPNSNW